MYAVVEQGGKQYRVAEGDTIRIEKAAGEPGEEIVLEKVLLVQDQDDVRVGKPFLEGVRVRAEILAQRRAKKIVVFKFKRPAPGLDMGILYFPVSANLYLF